MNIDSIYCLVFKAFQNLTNASFHQLTNVLTWSFSWIQLKFSIRIVASLIAAKDVQILEEACWALLYISHRKGGIETALYEAGLCLELAKLLE